MKKSNKSKNKDNINVIEQNNIDNKDIKVEKSKNNQKQNKEETSLIVVNENKKRKQKKKTKRHLFLKFILIMIILLMLLAISGMWLFAGLLLILELYLNILFVGGNNLHGVELGAEYYFNKSAKDLSLAESAFMAGINHSPNSYNPYNGEDNAEAIKNRTITVLNKMKELGYIVNEDEYNQAIEQVNAGLTFTNGSNNNGSVFSYHTDAVISQVVEQVMKERQMTEQMARNYVYSSGLTIHSTVDTNIQNRLEEEYKNSRYIRSGRVRNSDGTLLNEHTQSGMAIIDYKTGNVVAVTGTTDNVYDRWLCGFTPYYSAATWYGYDNSEPVVYSGNPAGQIWDAVMTDIHEGLPDATFERPEGIVERKVCSRTGGLATSRCRNTYTEIFTEDNLPETCKGENIIPKENLKLWTTLTRSRNNRKT